MKNYVHIATFTYPSDLTIAKSSLESYEIDCYVRDELTIQVHNFLSNAIGGIRLEVPEENHKQAIEILVATGFENFISGSYTENPDDDIVEGKNKYLKIAIKIVLGICIIWILVIFYLLIFHG